MLTAKPSLGMVLASGYKVAPQWHLEGIQGDKVAPQWHLKGIQGDKVAPQWHLEGIQGDESQERPSLFPWAGVWEWH